MSVEEGARILREAADAISGDRNHTHGDPVLQHKALMELWFGYERACRLSGWSAQDMPGTTGVHRLALLKISRAINGAFNPDDYRDLAGYAGLGAVVHQEEIENLKQVFAEPAELEDEPVELVDEAPDTPVWILRPGEELPKAPPLQ